MNSKTIIALAKLIGNKENISFIETCYNKKCPHCKILLSHKDHFFKGKRLCATGFCPKCEYTDPETHHIHTICKE